MRELPILFSTPMVQAITENRKIMTRRTAGLQIVNECPDDWKLNGYENTPFIMIFRNRYKDGVFEIKPRYQVGDHLWVKETWRKNQFCNDILMYKADTKLAEKFKWKSSLFMRKEYARIWLEVTKVRCERLQNINGADALAEGIEHWYSDLFSEFRYQDYVNVKDNWRTPVSSFQSLWVSINGIKSWYLNPWVFVYKFKQIDKPLNF